MASRGSIWAGLAVIYLVWGSTYLAIRFAVETLPPFLMTGVRFLVAGGILYAWTALRKTPRPTWRVWQAASITGLLMHLGGTGGVGWAEQYVPSGPAALLVATSPLWMVLLDVVRSGGKWPNVPASAGVLLGFVGAALLVYPSSGPGLGQPVPTTGAWVLFLAALAWSLGSVYSQGLTSAVSVSRFTAMQMLAGGAGLLLAAVTTGEWARIHRAAIADRSVIALLYLIILGSLFAYSVYVWLLQVAPIPLVSSHAYVNPVVAVLLGNLLGSEHLTPRVLMAALVIVGAVVLTSMTPRRTMKGST